MSHALIDLIYGFWVLLVMDTIRVAETVLNLTTANDLLGPSIHELSHIKVTAVVFCDPGLATEK